MKVAVLKGGRSLERQVSLRSGARVEDALAQARARGGRRSTPATTSSRTLKDERPDVAFVALHGADGEDGTVQELLEILAIPYTGPGVSACRRSMDKAAAKQELREAGIGTPDWVSFSQTAFAELGAADALEEIEERLGFPLVVKPARGGSSLGVRFAADRDDVPQAIVSALSYDDRVLLEQHVDGRELSVGMLDGEPLPIVEIRPRDEDRYSYEARYEIGRTEFICPAELDEIDALAVRDAATAHLGGTRLRGLRAGRPDPRRARPAGAGGERGPGAHRHLAVPDGGRGGGDRLRGALRADRRRSPGAARWPREPARLGRRRLRR